MRACPCQIRAQCYTTLVRQILEYSSPIWDHHVQKDINCLKKVGQIRQPREQCNPDTASNTVVPSRGAKSPSEAVHAILTRTQSGRHPVANYHRGMPATTRCHDMRYFIAYWRTTTLRHSFFPDAAWLWNKLPSSSSTAPSPEAYTTSLQGRTFQHSAPPVYTICIYKFTRHHLYSCTSLSSLYACVQYSATRIMHNTWKKKNISTVHHMSYF